MPQLSSIPHVRRFRAARFLPALAVVLGASAGGAPVVGQVTCDSPCVQGGVTRTPPKPGGTPRVTPTSSARALIDRMHEAYEERMASISDYLVVQHVYILQGQDAPPPQTGEVAPPLAPLPAPTAADEPSGPPAVIYFEKQQVEGRPTFVGVPPHELARREAQATGGVDLGQLANVLGEVMNKLPEGLRPNVSQDELTTVITGVDPTDRSEQGIIDYVWGDELRTLMRERGRLVRVDTIDGQPISVLYADDFSGFNAPYDFEMQAATLWLGFDDRGDPIPYNIRIHGWQNTLNGPKPVTVERNWGDFRRVGPMYQPFRITDRMAGLVAPGGPVAQAASALDRGVYTVASVVVSLQHNRGAPTQAQIAELISKGWQFSGRRQP